MESIVRVFLAGRCGAIVLFVSLIAGCADSTFTRTTWYNPSITSDNWMERVAAVDKISDQELLGRIASDQDQVTQVKQAAISS